MQTLTALDVAEILIKGRFPIRETGGKNLSPMINAINAQVANKPGDPYCAAGESFCFRMAEMSGAKGKPFPYTGSSQQVMRHFRDEGLLFNDPQKLLKCKGAVGGWTNPDGSHGHTFLVEGRMTDGHNIVTAIRTLEFNTDRTSKDRDGEGGYDLVRTIAELKASHPKFWFCDVSAYAGGAWWE